MTRDTSALYGAYAARDARFDGVFFIGVTSTGIYCRPICPAKTPRAANCRFFDSREAAEKADFRPCLRCRPELAPGNAPSDDAPRLARQIADRISDGMFDDDASLETVAGKLGWSSRQVRRIIHDQLGVSPIELIQTRRLLLAKQLLTDTALPITEVAYASGFGSLRRFNDAFGKRYRMAPSRFRRATSGATTAPDDDTASITVSLGYRNPFDWNGILSFLRARALTGVEAVDDVSYRRTVHLGAQHGWICVRHTPLASALAVDVSVSLVPVLAPLLSKLRHLFDLNARPDIIAAHLGQDALLAESVREMPGLRVPGCFDGFELAVRAVLGQQITVKGASTLASRFTMRYGQPVQTPFAELTRLAPTPVAVAAARVEDVASLGIVRTRAACIIALAAAIQRGALQLEPGVSYAETIARLVALVGIGPWTAQYVAMRALHWPDAFPREDAVLRKAMGGLSPADMEARSQAWSPWRSYATLHLWRMQTL